MYKKFKINEILRKSGYLGVFFIQQRLRIGNEYVRAVQVKPDLKLGEVGCSSQTPAGVVQGNCSTTGYSWATVYTSCTTMSSSSAASSSSAPGCTPPNITNISTGICEPKVTCTYPKLYSATGNSCMDNPNFCPPNSKPFAGGTCFMLTGDHSCPPGWHDSGTGSCAPDNTASSAMGGGSSQSNTSTANSTGNGSSTGSNSSVQSGGNDIGGGNPNSPNNTATQNCQLTFGVDRCTIMTQPNSCPNSYSVNGINFCIAPAASSGSGSSSGGGGGNSGSNTSQKGECDPTAKSYDECMGRNETPDESDTQQIIDDFDTAADKAIDDSNKAVKEDIEDAASQGISFKDAPNSLKAAVMAHIPQAQSCQNIPIKFLNQTKNINCQLFEKFKLIFAWFISIVTAYYIFMLAIKPVPR